MKEEAIRIALTKPTATEKLNVLREYLQSCVLRSLHESEAFQCLSFVGGTALRFLYELPRFSEDLDFSLEAGAGYDPVSWMSKAKRDLEFAGFDAVIQWNDRKTVHAAWFRFAELLKSVGLSPLAAQKVSIKMEIDTKPPGGSRTISTIINRHHLFALRHHDLSSLMAGKIHALITRKYPKGRDWYDLVWYRSRIPPVEPNLDLLQQALNQTQGAGQLEAAHWRHEAAKRLSSIDSSVLRDDVAPFLERPSDTQWLTHEHLRSVLKN